MSRRVRRLGPSSGSDAEMVGLEGVGESSMGGMCLSCDEILVRERRPGVAMSAGCGMLIEVVIGKNYYSLQIHETECHIDNGFHLGATT